MTPKPSKENLLLRLKGNIPIAGIVDVGVREQTYELIAAFPKIKHYLFEPVTEFFDEIRKNYKNVNYELFQIALSDINSSIYLILSSLEKNGVATHSQITDKPEIVDGAYLLSCSPIDVRRFDDISLANIIDDNFLLKIDVDGKDLNVLKGFGGCLKKASAIIVECTALNMIERMQFVQSQGFTIIDMVDLVYYGDAIYQFDAVLIRNDLITANLKPSFNPFQKELWNALKI